MIPIEVLRRVSRVFTHKNCPDGMATAMILRDAFRMLGTSPSIEFLAHGTPEHARAGHAANLADGECVLFCDIVPTYQRSSPAAGFADRTVVLDHHKGVEELVRSFGDLGVFADEKLEPGVSGAVLAYREVWLPIWRHVRGDVDNASMRTFETQVGVENFAECTGARDTWQTKDPKFQRGQWISKMIMSKPASWWLGGYESATKPIEVAPNATIRNPRPYLTEEEVQAGRALFEAHEEAVRQAIDQCVHLEVGISRLIVFQEQATGFRLCSDVAESLRQKWRGGDSWAVVAGFSYVVDKPGDDPKLLYSLRGLNGFDVASFAKANGGGGHTAAAGFTVPIRHRSGGATILDPYLEIFKRLSQFLP